MAAINRFMIAPIRGGLQTNLRPWLIPDDAFEELLNAYVFRGRIIKRFGGRLMVGDTVYPSGYKQLGSRLRVFVGFTDGSGDFTSVSGDVPGIVFQPGQLFSVGDDQIFTVYQNGAMLNTGTGSGSFDTGTGIVTITGANANEDVYFYPALPVMGLVSVELGDSSNQEETIAFDTQFAYEYGTSGWIRIGTAVWKGTNTDYFWCYNWRGAQASDIFTYVSNFFWGSSSSVSDPMYYYDPTVGTEDFVAFQPRFSSADSNLTIMTAKIILPFKDRLVLLNVVENTVDGMTDSNTQYVNRCRFSWNGDPTNAAAFYQDVPGSGGYIDAPTKEAIVTAQFLKDRLIVYFESSTWELVYTGNQILPFVWQQINTELGAESTFSQIPFDKVVLGIGNVGVHACNGSNVDRIDSAIPDTVFEIHDINNAPKRVYGIRDYFAETVYWSYPDQSRNQSDGKSFCNKVLVYNYSTGSWAINDDSITVFGYGNVGNGANGLTWENCGMTWEEATFTWESAAGQPGFRNILVGNQEGFVFILVSNAGPDVGNYSANCQSLQITNMNLATANVLFTVYDHNLNAGDFIKIEGVQGVTGTINNTIFKVFSTPTKDTLIITIFGLSGTYTGGGTFTRVTPPSIKTKQYNFYVKDGRNAYVSKVDFLVTRTYAGEFTVDCLLSSSDSSLITQGALTGSLLGSYILETSAYVLVPAENAQTRLWHPVYMQAEGECVQLRLFYSDDQTMNVDIAESAFEIHAMTFYATPTSSRLQ